MFCRAASNNINTNVMCNMRQLLIIISLLFSCDKVLSQLNLNIDDVLQGDIRELKKYEYYDTSFHLNSITNSTNVIEIRLYEHVMFGARCQILCFDGTKWSGKTTGILCYSKDSLITLNSNLNFYKILDSLTRNNIFTLPDQSALTLKGSADDGVDYSILYKVGSKFRSYEFSNPDYYAEMNKEIKELKNYVTVVAIMNKLYTSR